MKIQDIKKNPIIDLREKHDEELIEIEGYAGMRSGGMLRLYSDNRAKAYYEIPEKSILHVEEACKECENNDKIVVFLKESTEIRFIQPMKARELPSYHPFGPYPAFIPVPQFPASFPFAPIMPGASCIKSCIEKIKKGKKNFHLMAGPTPESIVYVLTEAAKKELYHCIENCGYKGSFLRYVWMNAIEELEGTATYTPDPPMPETP